MVGKQRRIGAVLVVASALAGIVPAALGSGAALAGPDAVPRGLVGTWTQGVGNSITFKRTSRVVFKVSVETVVFPVSGTPTRVTFGRAASCDRAGVYRWKVTGRKLRFQPVNDACIIRRNVLGGTWTRK